ncbi:MAG TPA: hypothetical protein VGB79_10500 [Allosphingosinicella sp.]
METVSAILKSVTLAEAHLKLQLITEFARLAAPGEFLHRSSLETLLEDLRLGLGDAELVAIMEDLNLWDWRGDEVGLKEEVWLDAGPDGLGRPRLKAVAVGELLGWLDDSGARDFSSPTEVATAVRQTREAFWAISTSDQTSSGLPTTFWKLDAGGAGLLPMGDQPSLITLLDIVNTELELQALFGRELAFDSEGLGEDLIARALDRCADHVGGAPGGFHGLLYFDGDDDFVEQGLLPNVPTTAHFVRALAQEQMRRARLGVLERPSARGDVAAGVAFLLRMQRDSGLWGTFRYDQPTTFDAPPHPYFTLAAVRALAGAAQAFGCSGGELDVAFRNACHGLSDYIPQRASGAASGAPNETLSALVEVSEACLALVVASDYVAPEAGIQQFHTLLNDLCDQWAAIQWGGQEIHEIAIHAPGLNGFLLPGSWEQPAIAKLIYYLCSLRRRGAFSCSALALERFDELTARISSLRVQGLWPDAKLEDHLFPSNSSIFCLALAHWISSLPDAAVQIISSPGTQSI